MAEIKTKAGWFVIKGQSNIKKRVCIAPHSGLKKNILSFRIKFFADGETSHLSIPSATSRTAASQIDLKLSGVERSISHTYLGVKRFDPLKRVTAEGVKIRRRKTYPQTRVFLILTDSVADYQMARR